MAVNRIFGAIGVTGTNGLVEIASSYLTDNDVAVVEDSGVVRFYSYDSGSSATDNSGTIKTIIAPTDNVGRWLNISPERFTSDIVVDASNNIIVNEMFANTGSNMVIRYNDGSGVYIQIGPTTITLSGAVIVTGTARFNEIPRVQDELTDVPTQDYHLTTKKYVDDTISVVDHNVLSNRGLDSAHTQYTLVDGTRAFTGPISGIDPVSDSHLVTRSYLNDNYVNVTGDTVTGSLIISGDLTVNGTTTTLNSTTLQIDDKNIELGTVTTPSDATADGGGITLKGSTDKTIIWQNSDNTWHFNQGIDTIALSVDNISLDANTITTTSGDLTLNATTNLVKVGSNIIFNSSTGQVSATSYITTSLESTKTNIEAFNGDAIALINSTDIKTFNFINDPTNKLRVGFIADYTNSILSGKDQDSFDIANTIGVLLKAVQQLSDEIERLKGE